VNQELDCLAPIYNAVVIAQRHIHHRPDDDLSIECNRSFFDLM
jgi:hypothetical protein